MNSPRYAPGGLQVEHDHPRIMVDRGPRSALAAGGLDAWLLTDQRAELIREVETRAGDSSALIPRGRRVAGPPAWHDCDSHQAAAGADWVTAVAASPTRPGAGMLLRTTSTEQDA